MPTSSAPNLSIVRGARPEFNTVDRLNKARQHGEFISNEELGKVAGIGRNKLGRLFSGSEPLTPKYALLIGVTCGVDPNWLLENEQPTGDSAPVGSLCAPWDLNPEPADYPSAGNVVPFLNPLAA